MAINEKRIFKNTIILYLRLFVVIILAFYASRILLQALGIDDFGIYNVVGGISAMFASLKSSFASATQRFYNFEIGKTGNFTNITKIFNISLLIHVGLALILLVLLEGVGVYMINNTLSIPVDRLDAANMVFQMTVVSTILSTLIIPFDAMILARERMDYYAVLSVVDAALKLALIFQLKFLGGDRLVIYSLMLLSVSLLNVLLSAIYCHRCFPECKIKKIDYDRNQILELARFGGWNFVGNLGFSLCNEVNNFFLNIFGGVVANAARGVVLQLKNAIMSFLSNTLVALRPQATQEFAANNHEGFYDTIFYATKMVYYIALSMVIPLFFGANHILRLWLGEVPQNAVIFLQISLIQMLIRSFHEPIDMIFKATGRLKEYQLISLCVQVLILPITYFILRSGHPIYWVFINMCVSEFLELVLIVRLASSYGLELKRYINQSVVPIVITTFITVVFAVSLVYIVSLHFIIEICILILGTIFFACILGMTAKERVFIKSLFLSILKRGK